VHLCNLTPQQLSFKIAPALTLTLTLTLTPQQLYLLSFKIAPALACGNTIVCKPSEFTSVTAWMLCSVMKEAGLPDGVCNMVFGYGHEAGQVLVEHPDVPAISFTGGYVVMVML